MSRPPQVRVRFFPPMMSDLAGSERRIYSLVSVPHRASPSGAGSPHSTAYYPLLVHRHGILPRPSFGPHLAVGTLVSANGSCGQARKGLSPSRFAPCWAHTSVFRDLWSRSRHLRWHGPSPGISCRMSEHASPYRSCCSDTCHGRRDTPPDQGPEPDEIVQ